MRLPRPAILFAVAALAATAVGCGKSVDEKKDAEKAVVVEAIAVSTTSVTKADVSAPIVATGSVTPSRQTDIGPSVDGIIEQVMVAVGSRVKKGDPLFKTRDVDIRLQVQEAEKQVALARAQHANAQAELQRQNTLKAGGWVSQSRLDTTRTNSAVSAAQLGVWEARLAQARQFLKDTIVRAPYDGVISRKDVYEGRFMATRFGGMSPTGGSSGVVQIMGIDPLAVIVQAPGAYFTQLKVGMKARVFVDGLDKPIEEKVDIVNYGIDSRSRSVEVRIAVANPDYKIFPGLYCRVELIPEPRRALVVERKAILGPDGSRYAFVEQNGRARKIPVLTRELDGERVEILSNIPEGTELLVGPNLSQLADGIAVKVAREPAKIAKPANQAKL